MDVYEFITGLSIEHLLAYSVLYVVLCIAGAVWYVVKGLEDGSEEGKAGERTAKEEEQNH